jgi:hypothetical protein
MSRNSARFHYFFFLICFMVFIIGASLFALIMILPTLSPHVQLIALLVILTSLLAIFINVYIIYKDVTKKSITHKRFRLIPCHRDLMLFGKEFVLCFRCLGFYVGHIFWGALTSQYSSLWKDLTRFMGPALSIILIIAIVAMVPIHGAWLRSHPSKARKHNILRSLIGFVFAASFWLIAGLITCILQ